MAIENILQATLSNLKSVMEVSNVIGKPIVSVDNALIIPISKVSVGYVAGGGQYSETPPKSKTELPEAGATGGGVNITPVGFLVCYAGRQQLIKIEDGITDNKWIELMQAAINFVKKDEE